jgi:hypothetical protein
MNKIYILFSVIFAVFAFAEVRDIVLQEKNAEQKDGAECKKKIEKIESLPQNMTVNYDYFSKNPKILFLNNVDYIKSDENKYIIDKKSSPSNIHVARQQKFWNEMNKIPKMLIKRNKTNNKKTKSYIYEYSIYQFNN